MLNQLPHTYHLKLKNVYRCDVLNMVMKRKWEMNTYSLSIQERRAWQRLKANYSIIVISPDKGRSTLVVNKSDYDDKLNDLLSIKENSQLPLVSTKKKQDKVKKDLKNSQKLIFIKNFLWTKSTVFKISCFIWSTQNSQTEI